MEPMKVDVRDEIVCPIGWFLVRDSTAELGDLVSIGREWVPVQGVRGMTTGPNGFLRYFVGEGTDYCIIRRNPVPVGECESLGDKLAECEKELALRKDALAHHQELQRSALDKIASLERRLREAAQERDTHADVSLKYMKAISSAAHTLNEALGLEVTT